MDEQTGKLANGQAENPSVFEFRKQLLWRKPQDFAERTAELVSTLPHDRAADVISGQSAARSPEESSG